MREVTAAAVLRIEEGFDGTLACFLGMISDDADDANDVTLGLGAGVVRGAVVE